MRGQDVNGNIRIEPFTESLLTLHGMRRNRDYRLEKGRLWIRKNPRRDAIKGKLATLLKEFYPQYSYYWETPQVLRWF